jgi:two-component system, chemotaxis family, sensor kinase CheA
VNEDEFLRLFAQEAAGRLDSLAQRAIGLEAGEPSREELDAMFRDAHTLKGGASVVGLEAVARRMHDLEQLLEGLRTRRRRLTSEVIDTVLAHVDAVRELIVAGDAPAAEASRYLPQPRAAATPSPPPISPDETISVPLRRLDELVRLVGESTAAQLRVGRLIGERLRGDPVAADEYHRLARVLSDLHERAMRARMLTVGTIAAPLQRAARDVARARGREVRWELVGGDTELDRHVLEALREPLVALVRNAVDHGVEDPSERRARGKPEAGLVRVAAHQTGADVVVAVADDGRGIDFDRVRAAIGGGPASEGELAAALFEPGVTTAVGVTQVSGRGVGLDAVRAVVDGLRGRIEVRSGHGAGTEFRITVPMTLAALRCLLVETGTRRFALPMHAADITLPAGGEAVTVAEGRPALWAGEDVLPLADLGELVGAGHSSRPEGPAVVLTTGRGRLAVRVDELLGQRDVVVQDLGRVLPRLPLIAGASVDPDGSLLLVLDPGGLVERGRARELAAPRVPSGAPAPAQAPSPRVLIVDDELMVRELERSILSRAGFEVVAAADGAQALQLLREQQVDLVLTDLEMPGVDGFALTRAIRADARLTSLPVLVLSGHEGGRDRRRVLDAGADAFLVKSGFDELALLGAIRRLLRTGRTSP